MTKGYNTLPPFLLRHYPVHRYYAAIRLPDRIWLPCFVSLVGHTPLRKNCQGLPSCRDITMCNVPRSLTPEELQRSCLTERWGVAFCWTDGIGLLNCTYIGAHSLQPWLSARYLACLRLNAAVASYAPRLATSGWLFLSRWASHPLYVTTLLGRSRP